MAARAFCARTSEAAGEDMAGTASTVRAFLLVEHGGPWGVSALRDAAFPDGVADALRLRCAAAKVRPMLMRRYGARPGLPDRPRVVLAACQPDGGRAAGLDVDDVGALPDLPWPELVHALRAGRTPDGWFPVPRFFGTCTHGRHDACCAERGRPVARALDDVAGDDAWEISHMGGDRFAGNVLVLPEGLYYGRVTTDRVAELVTRHAEGRCLPDLLRGRSSLPFPAQAAEVALRRHLALDAASAVRLDGCSRHGARTVTTWDLPGRGTWRVVVDTTHPGPSRSLTCSTAPGDPPVHSVVELTDVAAPGRGAQGWDDAYTGAPAQSEPSHAVTDALAGLPAGRVLDVAAGTGRHAVWLARRGWQVTAVDFSAVAVSAGAAAARSAGVEVDWQVGDARLWAPPPGHGGYDVVLLAFVQLPDVARRARQWLAPGGRLVVVGHSARDRGGRHSGPGDPRLLHSLESLREAADGLVVERLEETVDPGRAGLSVTAVLVARKPHER